MKYRHVGKYGVKVSEISIGAWITYGNMVEKEGARECLNKALEMGANYIDIADVYAGGKAEQIIGELIKEETWNRKNLIISSKVFWPMSEDVNDRGLSRKHMMQSIEGTLERLQLDYIDFYFCHRFDHGAPLEETILAMNDLVREGKILYWGTSVWTAAQLERVMGISKELGAHPPVVEQPRYNMFDRYIELEVMDTARYHGIGLVVWSPLAQGILAGRYLEGIPEDSRAAKYEWLRKELTSEKMEKVKKLNEIAKELDITLSQLSIAWILRRSEISSVITGASKPSQVEDNMAASDVKLDKDVLERIEEILDNKPELHPQYVKRGY